ncbi:hypothetical protein HQ520_05050, partial [bacterium]|nr:hypothetical protein [bacterium]
MFLFPLLPRTRTGSPFLLLSVFLIPWWISTATADPILDDPVLREYQNAEQTLPSRQPREEILPLPDFETSRQPAPARPSTRQAASPAAPLPVERVGSVDEIPLLTVIDLETNTLEPSETGVVTQVVWNAIQRAGHARLMRLQGSRQLLAEQDLTPSDPYRPPPPRDAVARALHADYLILGNVNRFQGAYALDLILYSAVLDSIVHSATVVTDEGGKFLLEKEIPAAVADLLRAVPRRALGPVSRDSRNGPSVPPGLLGREVEQLRLENERLREQLRRMEGPSTGFEPSTGAELNEDLPQLNPVQYGDKKYKTPGKTPIHIGEYEPEPDPSPESEESHVTMVAEAHTPTPEPTARPTPEPTPEPAH